MASAANDYDSFAQEYAEANESNAFNALYERPAVLSMLGDVAGLRVLDAGRGAGAHATALIERGATVEGLDLSTGLLEIARRRLGPDVLLRQADLRQPLPYADSRFDAAAWRDDRHSRRPDSASTRCVSPSRCRRPGNAFPRPTNG